LVYYQPTNESSRATNQFHVNKKSTEEEEEEATAAAADVV